MKKSILNPEIINFIVLIGAFGLAFLLANLIGYQDNILLVILTMFGLYLPFSIYYVIKKVKSDIIDKE